MASLLSSANIRVLLNTLIITGALISQCADRPVPPPEGGGSTADKALVDSEVAARILPSNPPNKGLLFVDHSQADRSGHLGHALVEYADDKLLAFFPNCSDDHGGHSAVGWMEFKRSEDGGKTWSRRLPLPFSKELFKKGEGRTAMAEKAIVTDNGEIVLFYLISDISENALWEPYWVPLVSRSPDGGESWSNPQPFCDTRGRVYDVFYKDGKIYALFFAIDSKTGWETTPEHEYRLYISNDGGKNFALRSVLPFDAINRCYGSLDLLADGRVIAYVYNRTDEYNLDYLTSIDNGETWSEIGTAHFSRKIRNPQFVAFDGRYYMHGRSGAYGVGKGNMILYMSHDGITWDDGVFLRMRDHGTGAYSNSIVVGAKNDNTENRLLIQASHAYKGNLTNILHWWVKPTNSTFQ